VDDDCEAMRRTYFSRFEWRPAVAKAEGAPASTGMHDLRHYYASLLIQHRESVKTVHRRLGHATAAETLDTYSHLWPDSDDRTREAVDADFDDVPPACPKQGASQHWGRSQAWGGRVGL
jgi:integrase